MSTDDIFSIQHQKSDVFEGSGSVRLKSSCVIGDGIISLSSEEKAHLEDVFDALESSVTFFIPASGSGSRMFADLVQFVESGESTEEIEMFFQKLPELALFYELPLVVRQKVSALQPKYVAEYLISHGGMDFTTRPKGLIPFHRSGERIYTPFQDQLIQAFDILGMKTRLHFTIQEEYEDRILDAIHKVDLPGLEDIVSFSFQDAQTDAVCFDASGNIVLDGEEPLRRPAGHGALLKNLDALEEDIVLIKNIDNIQHRNKSELNAKTWKYCTGLLLEFKRELKELSEDYSASKLRSLNEKYQFLSPKEVEECDALQVLNYASRPTRVCGMVINEGAPGGGPFWIEDANGVSKQIVEKVQICAEDEKIMKESGYFNPVFIALSKSDVNGNRLDLKRFVDHSKYLAVSKPYEGKEIRYRELPGLWNGSMSNWNTVFVEIPKEVFSPVKSVLDLMKDAHQA